jgi:hypothetical protein
VSLLETSPRSHGTVTRTGPRPVEALALLVLLTVGWLVTGPGIPFMSDEGQAELQVDLLDDGGWAYDSPFDEPGGIDEDRSSAALRDQGFDEVGAVPYGKHPLYPTLLRIARGLAGPAGTALVSIGAAVAAAWLAARLARELGARDSRPAFWLCGLASPLFFDGMIVFAHTLGAALAAVALLALVRLDRHGAEARAGARDLALLAGAVAAGVLFRNEAFLLAGGIAVAVVLVGRDRPARRLRVAAVVVAAAAGGWLLDRTFRLAVLGAPNTQAPPVSGPTGSLAGRLDAAHRTILEAGPALAGGLRAALLLWTVTLAVVVALAATRPERIPGRLLVGVGAMGVVLHLLRLATAGSAVIPGLAVAFPALVVLGVLLLLGRPGGPVRLVAAAVALAGAGVVALQYDRGGGLEWGGRFFAILLPALAALAVVCLQRSGLRADVPRLVIGSLLAVGVLTAAGSVTALHGFRSNADAAADAVLAAGELAGPLDAGLLPAGREAKPLVVTTEVLLPQILQPVFGEHDWLAPDPPALGDLGRRLADAGIERFVLLTSDADTDLAELPGWAVEAEVPPARGSLRVIVVARAG